MKNIRILLLGDYSNCHRTLATGLQQLGCDVTLASDGSKWMNCERHIDISRRPGKIGGMIHCVTMHYLLRGILSGFDIVAVHDPNFTTLRPERLRQLFDKLRLKNGKVFLTAMSTDIAYLDMVSPPDSPLRYSEWFIGDKPSRMNLANPEAWDDWHNPDLMDYQNYFYDHIDGAVSILYEYHLGMVKRLGKERAAYAGIPVDLDRFPFMPMTDISEKIKIFLGRDRTRQLMKGSDYLEQAARIVAARAPSKREFILVENRPFNEFIRLLTDSHLVLDQIYSYTPATTALMAMAYGRNVMSGAEPEYYDFIDEHDNHPIINAPLTLEELVDTIEQTVSHPESFQLRGLRSREFVERHNDAKIVAKRFLDFWTAI